MLSKIVTTELVGSGVGDVTSLVGMLPAKAVPESAHAKATAITNRFIGLLSFGSGDARFLASKTE
jgi:hypothetical protein